MRRKTPRFLTSLPLANDDVIQKRLRDVIRESPGDLLFNTRRLECFEESHSLIRSLTLSPTLSLSPFYFSLSLALFLLSLFVSLFLSISLFLFFLSLFLSISQLFSLLLFTSLPTLSLFSFFLSLSLSVSLSLCSLLVSFYLSLSSLTSLLFARSRFCFVVSYFTRGPFEIGIVVV